MCCKALLLVAVSVVVLFGVQTTDLQQQNERNQFAAHNNDNGIKLRLVGGANKNSGRLEMSVMGRWGTVCDKGWDMNASHIACRMLGFARALKFHKSQQGNASQPIWIHNISCVGCERSLNDCYHPAWGSKSSCDHSNDIGLICLPEGRPQNPSAKVMVDGRVEVSYYGVNRSICYDGFDTKDARVICRMNGYDDVAYITQIPSQVGTPEIEEVWLIDVACKGDESSIKECINSWNWENRKCTKNTNLRAGIMCKNEKDPLDVEFRLEDVTTPGPYSGRVTVKYYNIWGNICAKDLKLEDAHVICRMLSFTEGLTISHWGKNIGNESFEFVNHCKGTEQSTRECNDLKLKQVDACEEGNYAGLVCESKILVPPTPLPRNVRLTGGANNAEGRVEVESYRIWETVCNSGWDMREADVVCHMKGFDGALTAYKSFGEGVGPIWRSGLRCKGTEMHIENCESDGQEKTTLCNHSMDAGVVCRRYRDRITVQLESGSSYFGRVTLKVNDSSGSICGFSWDKQDANVACQMAGFKQALVPISHFGGGGAKIWLSNVHCSTSDVELEKCNHDGWLNNSCPKDHHAGVICQRPGVNDPNFGMRLVKVPGTYLSKVEVQYYGVWGAVSANNWSLADAHVACWSHGSGNVSKAGHLMYDGKLPILIDNLNCLGSENSLEDCDFKWGISGADQSRVAAVECTRFTTDVKFRLEDVITSTSTPAYSGRLTVKYNDIWGNICAKDLKLEDAHVICRMLISTEALNISHWAKHIGNVTFEFVNHCNGTEQSTKDCKDLWLKKVDACAEDNYAGVVCKPKILGIKLRLVGGANKNSGRLEMRVMGRWGTVCDKGWDMNSSHVACRMLGFLRALKFHKFQQGNASQPIWIHNISCVGWEWSLSDCYHSTWGPKSRCDHSNDIGLVCLPRVTPTPIPRIRLAGGANNAEGRVEVERRKMWGTFCNSGWDMREADVVCRMKGFDGALTAYKSFGEGVGPIWRSGLRCKGNENNIENCDSDGQEKTTSCNHSMDAGVVCRRYRDKITVQLESGSSYFGRVALAVNDSWGSICGFGWDKQDADVACQIAGFKKALVPISHFGGGGAKIWLSNVHCSTSDVDLEKCNHDGWLNNSCPLDHHAGVICQRPGVNDPNFGMRLVKVPGTYLSKVEVQYYGVWGAVSANNWSLSDAHVACWSHGSGNVSKAGHFMNDGKLPILIDNLNCLGSENSLEDCDFKWGISGADQSRVAAVECTRFTTDVKFRLEDVITSTSTPAYSGRLTVKYNDIWGNICAKDLKLEDAHVICRMLISTEALNISHWAKHIGNASFEFVNHCNGTEQSTKDCKDLWLKKVDACAEGNYAGVVCKPKILGIKLRLVGGANKNSGRLEMRVMGLWGTVCDKGWDMNSSHVACRMLGFLRALKFHKFQQGNASQPIWIHNISCVGWEWSLSDCYHSTWVPKSRCDHSNDIGLVCLPRVTPTPIPRIRLAGGANNAEGRVEVERRKMWGTFCNSGWDMREADVVCRMKGFDGALTAYKSFGEGVGPIWRSGLRCKGNENNIENCDSDGQEKTTSCNHSMDAGVVCRRYRDKITVQLESGSSYFGRVALAVNDSWGSICGFGWDKQDADVACQMAGFKQALVPISHFGGGGAKIWLSNVHCSTSDIELEKCNHDGWLNNSCPLDHHAGVICQRPGANDPNFGMRLVKVPGTNLSKVEVQYYGAWGAVSANNWSLADAHVACWSHGSGNVSKAGHLINDGKLPILIDNINCRGSENSLEDCGFKLGISGADQSRVAAVECTTVDNDPLDVKFRLENVTTSTPYSGLLTVKYYNIWGNICAKDLKLEDAHVICRMLNFTEALTISHWAKHIGNARFELVNHCNGTEHSIKDCKDLLLKQVDACGEGNYAGVVCKYKILVTPTPLPRNVRLAGGANNAEGRVEVERYKLWGTVCNSGWDMREADVVCRMKGFYGALTAYKSFGEGVGPIWMSGLRCKGSEGNIENCKKDGQEKTTSCNHSMDAGVVCRRYPDKITVQLESGSSHFGRVALAVNDSSGSICGLGWDKEDADVACKMIGYKRALVPISHFGGGAAKIRLSHVNCSKHDDRLEMCNHDGWLNNSCPKDHHAGVICQRRGVNDPNFVMKLDQDCETKLSKVLVQYYGVWGVVSANNWSLADAHVACWSHGSAKVSKAGHLINDGKLPILIDNVNCRGSEISLEDCDFKWGISGANHLRVAAVECTRFTNEDINTMTPTIVPRSGQRKRFGKVEIRYKNKDYFVCGDKWDIKDATVVCKMSGYPKGAKAAIRKYAINTDNLKEFLTGFECRGTERVLGECYRQPSSSCLGNFIAGVICNTGATPKVKLRLANSGRVEVFYGDEWGTVCNDGNSRQNARVICRMLGYVDVSSYASTSKANVGFSWFGNMQCRGNEMSIEECKPRWGEATCSNDNMLSVTCKRADPPHFQILGMDAITDSTANIRFQKLGSLLGVKAIYQIAVERRPFEERLQSSNTQKKPFEFKMINYTTSNNMKSNSYITAEIESSFVLENNNFTIGDRSSKPNDAFTNEPLQSETPYRVYVRIATESYDKARIYGDYSYVAFKTKKTYVIARPAKKSTSSRGRGGQEAVTGLSIVIVILITVIIFASVWFIRKQRNWKKEASDRNQGLEMADSPYCS